MNLRLNIQPSLRSTWSPVVERQFDLHLAPLRARLRRTQIAFYETQEHGGDCFQCEFSGRLSTGTELRVRASHSDGHVAVADVLSRVRREVRRRTRTPQSLPGISGTDGSVRTQ